MAILQAGLCAGLSVGMLANVAIAGLDEPNCQCRSPGGERRDLGTVECVQISGSAWLVRCEMSENTPYWNRLNEQPGCIDA